MWRPFHGVATWLLILANFAFISGLMLGQRKVIGSIDVSQLYFIVLEPINSWKYCERKLFKKSTMVLLLGCDDWIDCHWFAYQAHWFA